MVDDGRYQGFKAIFMSTNFEFVVGMVIIASGRQGTGLSHAGISSTIIMAQSYGYLFLGVSWRSILNDGYMMGSCVEGWLVVLNSGECIVKPHDPIRVNLLAHVLGRNAMVI